jgi:glycosyltransferase involved in cell wall biosynthesis
MALNVLIVVPAFNESASIGSVLDALASLPYAILVVDDGSIDETARRVQDKGVRVVRHALNMGLGAAIATGLEVARREGYDMLITFDADGQHNPRDVEKLIKALDGCDVAIGVRRIFKERMPFTKRIGNWILNLLTLILFGVKSTDSQSGLRAFNRKAIESIKVKSNRYEVSSEILLEVRQNRLLLKEVPVEVIYTRHSMNKGTRVADGFRILWKMLIHKPGGKNE